MASVDNTHMEQRTRLVLVLPAAILLWGATSAVAVAQQIDVPAGASTAKIQKALNKSGPSDTVRLAAGTFSLTKPLKVPAGVNLRGAGVKRTTLRLHRPAVERFSYNFMVRPKGKARGARVADLTVDGNRPASGVLPVNTGGGVKAGDGWTIENIRFVDINYFKLWIYKVSDVTARNNVFATGSGSSGRNDNIGGGRSENILIAGNTFAADAVGNALDIIRSSGVVFTGNTVKASPTATRSVVMEGVVDSEVSDNVIINGSITAQTDREYGGKEPLTNPRSIRITGNRVSGAPAAGIAVVYDTVRRGYTPGGDVLISGNLVSDTGRSGIAVLHCSDVADAPDRIVGNRIENPFAASRADWGTGCGTVGSSAISVIGGRSTTVADNIIVETTQRYPWPRGSGWGRRPPAFR